MENKIKTREEVIKITKQFQREGKRVGFTSGTFDFLHAGHVDYLYEAKKKCDLLIVGVNTDESVKKYKDPNRPINNEKQRTKVISGLEMVDYVFLFNEINNNLNIELIKPDFYIKAGDYSLDKLTSKPLVEKYGGSVILIPIKEETSTTAIFEKIKNLPSEEDYVSIENKDKEMIKAVFLDRDGVINEGISYLYEPEKFTFTKNALEGLKDIQDKGYKIIIATDQAGIGLGYFSKEDFFKLNGYMFKLLGPYGIKIDKIYYCPHSITEECNCKKPKTGLIEKAVNDYNGRIDIKNSYFIGDQTSDIKCGKDFGLKTILVKTGKAGTDKKFDIKADEIVEDLLDASRRIK
ncbi:MAG: HAD-IIIA family hydrolase [Candidatus Nanoarchaeia archaeon]|nr:HAD-IIIA family hydrolase [Candidatus Nanoarchaeia archaeon]